MKINWIEFGLPWRINEYDPDEALTNLLPEYPTKELAKLTKEKFGTTFEEVTNKIEKISEKKLNALIEKDQDILRESNYEKTREDIISETKDNLLKKYLTLLQLWSEISLFEMNTDIVKAYNQTVNNIKDEYKKNRPKKSFYPDLAKPGTIIELESGKRMIIGDINVLGGVCNDCVGIDDKDLIVRYAIIYNGDE